MLYKMTWNDMNSGVALYRLAYINPNPTLGVYLY